jgi:hypothetical protein
MGAHARRETLAGIGRGTVLEGMIPGVLRSPWRDHTTHYVGLQPGCELLVALTCIGGHLTDPNEQKTQQSPGLGRSNALHPSHS